MSRYDLPLGIEGESEPGSKGRVLRNRLGIIRKKDMDQAEANALLRAQTRYLSIISQKTMFTATLLCRMHREWLGSIYGWAGRYRTVEVSKGGFHWPPAFRVPANMDRFEMQTLRRLTPCTQRDTQRWAAAAAEVQAEFLLVHPFREGNGRIARWLTDLMAQQAGFPALHYGFTGKGGTSTGGDYLTAVLQGYAGNYLPLADFLAERLRRTLPRPDGLRRECDPTRPFEIAAFADAATEHSRANHRVRQIGVGLDQWLHYVIIPKKTSPIPQTASRSACRSGRRSRSCWTWRRPPVALRDMLGT